MKIKNRILLLSLIFGTSLGLKAEELNLTKISIGGLERALKLSYAVDERLFIVEMPDIIKIMNPAGGFIGNRKRKFYQKNNDVLRVLYSPRVTRPIIISKVNLLIL
jgi:hypothetical protein